jgi:DNA-binding NtrC family response regulator
VPSEDSRQSARVLADDDDTLRGIIAEALLAEGYGSGQAGTVEDVRSALTSEQWGLVLLDTLGTGGTEREELLQEVCQLRGDTPLLLITGWTDFAQWAEAACSIDGVLMKPFDLEKLLERVVQILSPASR